MTAEEERAELDARIRVCPLCDLTATRNKAVPGDGPLEAKIMFVGEAPGFHEDRQGRPFVGQAGSLLRELLHGIGLNRDDVLITNIVKCRPPENRDPHPGEIAACQPYLDHQLRLFNPRLVVTLGRHSMGKFFPGQMISKIHGQPKRADGRIYYPLYHPAAVLRSDKLRPQMDKDFQRIPSLLTEAEAMDQDVVAVVPLEDGRGGNPSSEPEDAQPPDAVQNGKTPHQQTSMF